MGLCPLGEVEAGGVGGGRGHMVISLRQGWEAETPGGRQRGRDPRGKGGGVSGVRLGNDRRLTGCERLKQGGGAC